jgi:acyl-CoA thioester hydrolase
MTFEWPVRIYYEDTDSGGVVYYANYLRFMERARTEWLRSFGFEQDQLIEEQGIIFAVRSVAVDYLRPARFNDQLIVVSGIERVRGASIDFGQSIWRGNEELVRGSVRVASLNSNTMTPAKLPKAILNKIK